MATTSPLNFDNHPTHVVLDLGCTRSIGSRAAMERFKKHAWYYGITMESCRCNKSFVFANSETDTCMESCVIHFSTTPPCSTKVDVLETGDVPILFVVPQMRSVGMTIELDPMVDKITCPAFDLYSSPVEYSTMGHIVLDLTSLAYQPTTKSSERSGHPKRHLIFAMSKTSISSSYTKCMERKMMDPMRSLIIWLSLMMKITNLRCIQHQRKNLRKNGVTQLLMTETWHPWCLQDLRQLYQCEGEKDLQYDKTQLPHWKRRLQETRVIEQRMPRFWAKKAASKPLRNIANKMFYESNMRDLHLKHYHMSTAQFKKRTTHLDIPGNFYDLYQHVVKTCPFCNSIKPRPERSR